jgi:hypothetical protein
LAATVALGPLCLACAAHADTQIANATTNAVKTSTGGNITITSSGSIAVKTGAAVTVDSSNSVSNAGAITMNVAGNSTTGILITTGAGISGNVANSGTIDLEDGFTRTDSNGDGIKDGPWASGTDRCGICLTGAGALTGNITVPSGTITVKGENSFGIKLDSQLNGNFSAAGSITVVGDNSVGFQSLKKIQGDGVAPTGGVAESVHLGGSISVTGQGAKGVDIEGDVTGGRTVFDSSITVTGYSITSRVVGTVFTKMDPSDFAQSGPAVTIAGNLSNGALFDAVPAGNISSSTDLDSDGVVDTNQHASSITVFGSAPAIQIGSAAQTNDIVLSPVGTTVAGAAADYNYGLILKGTVTANALFDRVGANTFSATAVQIGAGGGNVTIAGGIRNTGSITATAFQAQATGLSLTSGATAPVIRNEGTIAANSTSVGLGDDAVAILIGANATTNVITNSNFGRIAAGVSGESSKSTIGDAVAIRDVSGTLNDVENRGSIIAFDDSGLPPDEDPRLTAVDDKNNTTGVTIHQFQLAPGDTTPAIVGSIFMGSGADTLNVESGTVRGAFIDFGTGLDSLIVNGPIAGGNVSVTTSVIGAIYQADGQLSIDVASGYLQQNNSHTLAITNLHVGSNGTLVVTMNPNGGSPTGGFLVSNAAVFDNNASIGVRFASLVTTPSQFVLVDASGGTLTVNGSLNTSSLQVNTPFLYEATFDPSQIALKKIVIDVVPRTAQQLGMNAAEAAMYPAFLLAAPSDSDVETAFLNQTTKSGFFKLYDQMMPMDAAAPLLSLATGVEAVSRAMFDRRPITEPGELTGWAQEIDFFATKKAHDSLGFSTFGFGLASGIERGTALGALGVSLAFTSSNLNTPDTINNNIQSDNLLELGVYWRYQANNFRAWARGAGGYAWFDSTREFTGTPTLLKATARWSGYSAAAAGGVSYEANIGRYYFRPEASAEYFYLSQNAHAEGGAGEPCGNLTCDSFDLGFKESSAHMATALVMLNMGARFGEGGWLQPELHVGYRQNFAFQTGGMAFYVINPSTLFALTSDSLAGGGPVLGFRVMAAGPGGFIALEGDTDLMKLYRNYKIYIRAGYRF